MPFPKNIISRPFSFRELICVSSLTGTMVLCILVLIPEMTVYSASLFVLCMVSSCGLITGQWYNKRMALERLLAYLALCCCLQKILAIGLPLCNQSLDLFLGMA